MSEYVIMPKADYVSACNKIREKTQKTDLIKSGDLVQTFEEIIPTSEEKTIAPDFSGGDMEVTPGEGAMFSKVTVQKPDTLIPENIAKGKTIAGVTGNMSGGEVKSKDKAIRFYDPYGEVIYGYTLSEIQELSELPPGPALKGVVFDRWTHTLEELKATVYFADVGPMYKYGSTPVTVLILETLTANTTVKLNLELYKKATIIWGDGSTTANVGGTSWNKYNTSHTYSTIGVYVVAIYCESTGRFNLGYQQSSYNYGAVNTQVQASITSALSSGKVDFVVLSILIGSYTLTDMYPIMVSYIPFHNRVRFVSMYHSSSVQSMGFLVCSALETIAGNAAIDSPRAYTFYGTTALKRLLLSRSIAANAFTYCDSMEEVIYGSGSIGDNTMNSKWVMLMTTETPPTISAASPIWGTKPIYVPDTAVETYKTADGWSNVADYIFPASQYIASH